MKNFLLVLIGFLIVCTIFERPRNYLDSLRDSSPNGFGEKIVSAAAGSVGQIRDAVTAFGSQQRNLPEKLRSSLVALEAKARRGATDAQYKLSLAYEQANFIEEAHAWASVAASNGFQLAHNLRERLERGMSPSQKARSQMLIDELLPGK